MWTGGLKELAGGSRTSRSGSFRHEISGLKSGCRPVKGREWVESNGNFIWTSIDAIERPLCRGQDPHFAYIYRHMCWEPPGGLVSQARSNSAHWFFFSGLVHKKNIYHCLDIQGRAKFLGSTGSLNTRERWGLGLGPFHWWGVVTSTKLDLWWVRTKIMSD